MRVTLDDEYQRVHVRSVRLELFFTNNTNYIYVPIIDTCVLTHVEHVYSN
jgi:hypothetical protein